VSDVPAPRRTSSRGTVFLYKPVKKLREAKTRPGQRRRKTTLSECRKVKSIAELATDPKNGDVDAVIRAYQLTHCPLESQFNPVTVVDEQSSSLKGEFISCRSTVAQLKS
jgi:hypothetical protein